MTLSLRCLALTVCTACLLVGCSPVPDQTDTPPVAAQVPAQTTPVLIQNYGITVPHECYPASIEEIPVTLHLPEDVTAWGAHAPVLEKLADGTWHPLRFIEGFSGTPQEIIDGTRIFLMPDMFEGVGQGKYRVGLDVSFEPGGDADTWAYATFTLAAGALAKVNPPLLSADVGQLTLIIENPSEGLVSLAETDPLIELKDGDDRIGCGVGSLDDILKLDEHESGVLTVTLPEYAREPGVYRIIIVLERAFRGEKMTEVSMPVFELT